MRRVILKPGVYYDSVKLLLLSKEMGERAGVRQAMVAMATPTNLEILLRQGWSADEVGSASENDLLIAVEAEGGKALDEALEWFETRLSESASGEYREYRPKSLRRAIQGAPRSNVVQISVPGPYAYREARRALLNDRHVMLFSDNVPVTDEVSLKDLAQERGLLLMGPDCGTAIINGICLGFANVVPRGPVGIVAASGTGAQEVSVLLARMGVGISQLIGTGGRDLSREVGGRTMRMGLRALSADPRTAVIVLVSKPPAKEVGAQVLAEAGRCGKPVVVNFLGEDPTSITEGSLKGAGTLEEAALLAAEAAAGSTVRGFDEVEAPCSCFVLELRSRRTAEQRYLRGLFVGGTLADEAMLLLRDPLGTLHSNAPVPGCRALKDGTRSEGHVVLDLGADEFTRGRAHPMIDPTLRNLRIIEEAGDPEVAVLLLDVVLGYGSHPDPGGTTAKAVEEAMKTALREGRELAVVASVCGTNEDPQNLEEQEKRLRRVGVRVFPSNARACRFAAGLVGG